MLMMLPFEAPTIFEGIHKSYFRMPRVVKDQRSKFENDDLFRQLSHESAVKYTGFKDRPMDERQSRFLQHCQEGHTEISVVQSGNQFTLMFNPPISPNYATESCDYKKEHGKVHLKSPFILNGVCVLWRGWIDIQRLEGFGCLEFDTEGAQIEESLTMQDRIGSQSFDQVNQKHQQMCNNHLMNSPLGRLNQLDSGAMQIPHHMSPPNHLQPNITPPQQQQPQSHQPPPPTVPQSQSQQTAPPPPLGLNTCIGPPPLPPPGPPCSGFNHLHSQTSSHLPPPVSMAESALHYSNAIAAAAVYQAFSGQSHSQAAAAAALHGLGSQASASIGPLAASLAASNGNGSNGIGPGGGPAPNPNVRFSMNNALNLCDVNSR